MRTYPLAGKMSSSLLDKPTFSWLCFFVAVELISKDLKIDTSSPRKKDSIIIASPVYWFTWVPRLGCALAVGMSPRVLMKAPCAANKLA